VRRLFFPLFFLVRQLIGYGFRTWVLLLGMSGLIVLFWFLKGGEVLRYFVSWTRVPLLAAAWLIDAGVSLGVIRGRHVMPLRPLGRHRCVCFNHRIEGKLII
jgi:hypothetical protein